MGKKNWLSMHPRNFGSEKIVRKRPYVRPPIRVSRGEILHFKYPRVSAVNRIATRTFRGKKAKTTTTTTKTILSFDLILMSPLTWITEKELKRAIKNIVGQFRWKNNMKMF